VTSGGTDGGTGSLEYGSVFSLGLLLRRAHQRAVAAFTAALAPHGIELRHFAVLTVLSEDGPLSQRDLIERIGSDKTAMVRVVDDLEAAGLAVRRTVPGDRRVRVVELTAKGHRMIKTAHRAAQDVAPALLAHLKPADRERFAKLLREFVQGS
jgi:DNA-binding MarR family transcriptional regulator